MSEQTGTTRGDSLSSQDAISSLFDEFDFGDRGKRTKLCYRSGARAFLRFVEEHEALSAQTPLEALRTLALVHTLRATTLRAGDLCNLTRTAVRLARQTGGYLRIEMAQYFRWRLSTSTPNPLDLEVRKRRGVGK